MKTQHIVLFLMLMLSIAGISRAGVILSADQVAYKVYHRDVGRDMQMSGTMLLISARGQQRQREYVSKRLDSADERKVIIRFTAPADITGTGFLVREINSTGDTKQHLYLPALKRTRRIVASQQGRKFVNSDFTYENMHRQPLKNWRYKLDPPAKYSGRACYVLISEPRASTDTQYGRTVTLVDAVTFMPLKVDFYDRSKRHCKTYMVKKIAMVDNIATEMEVIMHDLLSGHSTQLFTRSICYNGNLKDSLFTVRALEQ